MKQVSLITCSGDKHAKIALAGGALQQEYRGRRTSSHKLPPHAPTHTSRLSHLWVWPFNLRQPRAEPTFMWHRCCVLSSTCRAHESNPPLGSSEPPRDRRTEEGIASPQIAWFSLPVQLSRGISRWENSRNRACPQVVTMVRCEFVRNSGCTMIPNILLILMRGIDVTWCSYFAPSSFVTAVTW